MTYKAVLSDEIKNCYDEIVYIRRMLHSIPEGGLEELKTSKFIKKYLDDLGIEREDCADTGIIANIKSKISSDDAYIAFRCDMDAISVSEETQAHYASKHDGFMHACGHDGHMAVILILAKVIKKIERSLKINVLFIFQPAEEGPGGAEIILNEGVLDKYNIKSIYGFHLYPDVSEGHIALRKGAMMAMTGEFDIRIIGKGGHGAMPHQALDSVVLACELVGKFQNIISRSVSPIRPAVITVGKLYAGERRNVIAKEAIMEGTVRAFDDMTFNMIWKKMISFCKGIEVTHDCDVHIDFRPMYPAVINDSSLCDLFIRKNGESFDIDEIEPQMTAEDFASYLKKYRGIFIFIGTKNTEKGYAFPLHNSKFNFDERVLLNCVQAFYNMVPVS